MIGMRSGFKKVAKNVAGSGEAKKSKKASIGSTLVTIVLLVAAAALLYRRFR